MKNEFADILNSLADCFQKESKEQNQKIVDVLFDHISKSYITDMSKFEEIHLWSMYRLDNIKEHLANRIIDELNITNPSPFNTAKNKLNTLLANYSFFDGHFSNIFEKFESHVCCADKSSFCLNAVIRYYITGEKISFDFNQEYTYHLPTVAFDNCDQVIDFFESLCRLLYGKCTTYLEQLSEITKRHKANYITDSSCES